MDYVNSSGTLEWAATDTSNRSVTIQIINDTLWEKEECFFLILYDDAIIHDKAEVCIRANGDPGDCDAVSNWNDWTNCSRDFGIGQQVRSRQQRQTDTIGTVHCETFMETQACTGNLC